MHALDYQPYGQGFDLFDTSDLLNRDHPLAQGVVSAYFTLPGLDGGIRWLDVAGQNHGVLTNGPRWGSTYRPGGFGELRFDGVNDQVNTAVFGYSFLSLTAWARRATTGIQHILNSATSGYTSGFDLRYIGTNDFRCIFCGSSTTTDELSTSYNVDTNWHCYTMTYDGATSRLYADGVQIGSKSVSSYAAASNVMTIGQGTRNPGVWTGAIDAVTVHSRALSALEVFQLYQETRQGCPTLLRRAYPTPFQLSSQQQGGFAPWLARQSNIVQGGGVHV